MNEVLQHFISECHQTKTLDSLDKLFHHALTWLGCCDYVYTHYQQPLFQSGRITHQYMSDTIQQWHEHYHAKQYETVDPIHQRVTVLQLPECWDLENEYQTAPLSARKLFADALDFSLQRGISFPSRNAQNNYSILVVHQHRNVTHSTQHIDVQASLQYLVNHYHHNVNMLLSKQHQDSTMKLTPREKECLYWTGQNKMAGEIARLLGTSTRTVSFHLENAIDKLNVYNKYQAVIKALQHNLL